MAHSEALYSSAFASCPEDWDVIPFEEAVDFREGPGILAKDFCDDGVPLLRLRNIERPYVDMAGCNFLDPEMVDRKWNHFRVEAGDLLVSTSGTLGRVSIATDDAAGSIPYTGIIRMRPAQESICAGFIRYFLTSPVFQKQAEASAAGSVLRHFGPSHLWEMSVPVPPEQEQQRIADILGSLDEEIGIQPPDDPSIANFRRCWGTAALPAGTRQPRSGLSPPAPITFSSRKTASGAS